MSYQRRMTAVTVSGFSQKLGIEIAEKKMKLAGRLASYGGEENCFKSKFLKNDDIINERSEYIDYNATAGSNKAHATQPNE